MLGNTPFNGELLYVIRRVIHIFVLENQFLCYNKILSYFVPFNCVNSVNVTPITYRLLFEINFQKSNLKFVPSK